MIAFASCISFAYLNRCCVFLNKNGEANPFLYRTVQQSIWLSMWRRKFMYCDNIGVSLKFKFGVDEGRENLVSFSSSVLLWETRVFPESTLQVTNHVLLSDRKLQENIEEQHVMRMEVVTVWNKNLFQFERFQQSGYHIHASFNMKHNH